LSGYNLETNTATVKAYLNPLVLWIWISALFFIGGTTISLLPDRRRSRALADEQSRQGANRVLETRVAKPNARSSRPRVVAASGPTSRKEPS
jgi:hypothetical protein